MQGFTAVGFFEIATFYVRGEFETSDEVLDICHGVKVTITTFVFDLN
jgi:hypothetical protein